MPLVHQTAHIERDLVRLLLSDHYERTSFQVDTCSRSACSMPLCQHGMGPSGGVPLATAASLVAQISGRENVLNIVWCAFGSPCTTVYFPLFLESETPEVFGGKTPADEGLWSRALHL